MTLTRSQGLNLLPQGIQRKRQNLRLFIMLTAAQVAIVLVIIFAVRAINTLEGQAMETSRALSNRVSTLRNSPEIEASAYARELYHQLMADEVFLSEVAPLDFDPQWLTTILALDTGHMTAMDYDGGNITITGIVNDLEMIEAFRQNLADTGIFEYVGLGRIRSQDELFIYELLIMP